MATDNLINHYDRRTLMEVSEELMPPKTFLVSTFFNETDSRAQRFVDMDLYKGKRRVAAYVKRAAEGQLVDALGYTTKTFEPPYLKPKTPITADDIQKRQPGQSIYGDEVTLSPAIQNFVARQIADQDDMITRNEELQARQALFDGKVSAYDEDNKLLAEIDYGRDASLTATLGTKWDASGSDKLNDLRTYRRLVNKKSGFTPRLVLMGSDAADEFLKDTTVQNQLSTDWSIRGKLAWDMRDNGGIWLGYADGFDFWTYEEYIENPENSNTEELLIPAKKVLVASPQATATRMYGSVEYTDRDGNLNIEATPRLVDMYGVKDPASTMVQTHSAPLMVTNHPDAYATLTVLT